MPVPVNDLPPTSSAPLAGITVVSVEQAVAAPFATRQLADLGARVIKVERPGTGDFARYYDATVKGLASYFVWLNVLGRPELADDPRFATNAARVAARADLHREMEAALSAHPLDEVLALLDAAQIANARLNTVGDLLAHPQLEHRWAEMQSPAGPIRTLPSPVSTGGTEPAFDPIPAVGEHTDAIMAELGLTDAEIAALRSSGAV
jgi:crotonobetainyl-CoA:carnitine CoA-transferase CaiB-like acyl-CoA transferase